SKEKRHFQRISIELDHNNQFQSASYTVPVEVHERIASGKIKYSLLGATEGINLPTNVAYQFIDIFESRIDFSRQLRTGDTFQLVYESFEADGYPVGTGKILTAQFINSGKAYNAMWFSPENKNFRSSYLTFDGKSLRTTFLAYPLEYTRVSSQFGPRLHPIHGTWRNHSGIDYAAPTGTPIRTLGDGRVTFAGTKSGYGKVVYVEHTRGRTTIYAHMSRINVTTGQMLEQGDVIGEVGQTGWATGPHLHLEFLENGTKKDPAILAKHTETQEMSPELMTVFEEEAKINAEFIERIARLSLIEKPPETATTAASNSNI
ncbi:MAG: peptidoglycan DD-metalloendopeptidase family protein, partial [Saezia sp.]